MRIPNALRCLMQVAGAGVVTQAGPEVQDLVLIGVGQRCNVRKTCHEALEIGNHGADLGLLQHDFRDPNPIGRARVLPRQIMPAMAIKPGQQHVTV